MPRTIYFSGSITAGRNDVWVYRRIVDALRDAGHHVLCGSVISDQVGAAGEPLDPAEIYTRDAAWIEEAAAAGGLLVAEVSLPSTGVGIEIGIARHRHGMPVICLFRPVYTTRCSAMVSGDPAIRLIGYRDEELEAAISALIREIGE